jgi:predicted alpha/beta hydrolase family esterase
MKRYLILAGIYDSGPTHWQTLWQQEDSRFLKLEHASWDKPDRREWVDELDAAIADLGGGLVLVAHSLACLMVVHWAAQSRRTVDGALLVSVPDPSGPGFPADATYFADLPMTRLPFPSTVVCSSNDPYGSPAHMRRCADAWGSKFVEVGALGHINASSNLGAWQQGRTLLRDVGA